MKYPMLTKLGLLVQTDDGEVLNEKKWFTQTPYDDLRDLEDNSVLTFNARKDKKKLGKDYYKTMLETAESYLDKKLNAKEL